MATPSKYDMVCLTLTHSACHPLSQFLQCARLSFTSVTKSCSEDSQCGT